MPRGRYSKSDEHKQRISNTLKGRKLSLEIRKKISLGLKNVYDSGIRKNKGKPGNQYPFWKGDDVGYGGVHDWIRKHFGRAKDYPCMFCNNTRKGKKTKKTSARMEWANLDGKYTRDLSKWTTLCQVCHWEYDKIFLNSRNSTYAACP